MPRFTGVALATVLSFVVLAAMAESSNSAGKSAAKSPGKKAGVTVRIDQPGASAELESLRDKLAKKVPGISRDDIRPSPIPGVYEIQRGHLFAYVSADGQYLIQGDLVNIETGEQITEGRRQKERLALLKELGEGKSIDFMPKSPVKTKYVITVFTDIDCGYCRKLHSEIDTYNAAGIGVRYMFFPRSGPNTESFYKAQAVWCSADRRDALTRAKQGENIVNKKPCDDPVMKEFELASELGVRGTPALLLPNGELLPGYMPAQQLIAALEDSERLPQQP